MPFFNCSEATCFAGPESKTEIQQSEQICVYKSVSHVWLFVTPQTTACQAFLSMEFSRQEYWSGLAFPSPEDLPNPGIETWSPASQADSVSGLGRSLGEGDLLPTPIFWPGEFHGLYSTWGHKELDTTERLSLSQSSKKKVPGLKRQYGVRTEVKIWKPTGWSWSQTLPFINCVILSNVLNKSVT